MFAVHALRRVRVTGAATGTVAIDAATVIPATRVLADVAADGADVTNLRACNLSCRAGKQAEAFVDGCVLLDLRQRGQCADLDSIGGFTDSAESGIGDAREIDNRRRSFRAVLDPVEAVLSPGDFPSIRAEFVGEIQRISNVGRLIKLEHRHHIF
jgi:hypothetical protein